MQTFMCVQMSPAWHELRRGIPSASAADRIITPTGKPSSQQEGYIAELIGDKFCLDPNAMTERPMNAAMRHGVACEPQARAWYAMETGQEVQQVGWCLTDDSRFGASPDGLVGDEGSIELKVPAAKTHTAYLLAGNVLPPEYRPQVNFQLMVTGRPWVDFVSFCLGLPALRVRVEPSDYTKELRVQAEVFYAKFQAALARIKGM